MKKNKNLFGKNSYALILLAVVILNSSYFPQYKNTLVVPPATNDFSWIKQFNCIYDLFNQDQWEKNPDRSFDSLGVHLTKKNYHPVNACHYALYCYDEYAVTKNEKFKKAFLAQINYLRDSTKYKEFNSDKVGYPYTFVFHDLKPTW